MLLLKAVKAVIKDKEGKILFVQKNPETRPTDIWDLPGGLVEENESEEEALLREVQEELGVEAKIKGKVKTWHFNRLEDDKRIDVQNYDCKLFSQEIILSDEHIRYKWLSTEEIREYPVKDESIHESLQ